MTAPLPGNRPLTPLPEGSPAPIHLPHWENGFPLPRLLHGRETWPGQHWRPGNIDLPDVAAAAPRNLSAPPFSKSTSLYTKSGGAYADLDLATDFDYFLQVKGITDAPEAVDINAATIDGSGHAQYEAANGMPDLAELLLLQAMLQDETLDCSAQGGVTHAYAAARWEACFAAYALEEGADPIDPRLQRIIAAYSMLGDPVSFTLAMNTGQDFQYYLTDPTIFSIADAFLFCAQGDADGDGYSNLLEWEEVLLTEIEGQTAFDDEMALFTSAAFDAQQVPAGDFYTMTRSVDGSSVYPYPIPEKYRAGTYSITAVPSDDWLFDHWEITPAGGDPVTVTENPTDITMDTNYTVAMFFAPDPAAELEFADIHLEQAVRVAVDKFDAPLVWGDVLGGNLTELDASDQGITSLDGIECLIELEALDLSGNDIQSISRLAELTSLRSLDLAQNEIVDITPLAGLAGLESLELGVGNLLDLDIFALPAATNAITDVSALSNLTALTYLGLAGADVADVSPLSGLTSLQTLWLDNTLVTDITPLSALSNLVALGLGGLGLTDSDMSILSNWPNLMMLSLFSNNLGSLTGVSNCSSLQGIAAFDNPSLVDISGLNTLSSLNAVLLSQCLITNISALQSKPNLELLLLEANDISDLMPLTGGSITNAAILVRGNPLSETSLCTHIPALEADGNIVDYDGVCGGGYFLTTAADPTQGGTVHPFLGTREYPAGTEVCLQPESFPSYLFSHWTGDVTSNTPNICLDLDANKSVTAVFQAGDYTLTMLSPVGVGSVTPAPGQHPLEAGQWLWPDATAGPGWVFLEWRDGNGDHVSYEPAFPIENVQGDVTLQAEFVAAGVRLQMEKTGEGAIAPDVGRHYYQRYTDVPLSAWSEYHWYFAHWIGDVEYNTHSLTRVFMDQDKTVTGVFSYGDWELTVNQVGNGAISPASGTHYYGDGVEVPLSATPEEGWFWDGWSGDKVSSDRNTSVLMDSNKAVTASFSPAAGFIDITIVGNGVVSADGGECHGTTCYYRDNELTTVHADADSGWMFDHWEGAMSGADPWQAFYPADGLAVTAVFVPIPHDPINFVDTNLQAAVCAAINKTPCDTVYVDEVVGAGFHTLAATDAGITDLTGIEYCRDLASINLAGNPIADVSQLASLPLLQTIRLSGTSISSILPLHELNHVEYLYVDETNLDTFENVTHFVNLKALWFDDNPVLDLSSVTDLTNIEALSLINCGLTDVTPLGSLTGLTKLYLGEDAITNWAAVSNLTALAHFWAYNCGITDLAFLTPLQNLTDLDLSDNAITDLTPLGGLAFMKNLWLGWNQITDLAPLAMLTNLEHLDLPVQTPGLSDLTPLQDLTALRVLNLSSNQNIADLSPLDGLTALESLNLDNNSIVELAALVVNSGIGAGDEVRVGGNPLSQTARCDELAILEGRGVSVTPTAAEVCTYVLTWDIQGNGYLGGATSGSEHAPGTPVTLTAYPGANYHFLEWQGDLTGSTNPGTVTMDTNRHVTAVFKIDQHTLDVSAVGSGQVMVDGVPASGPQDYGYGSVLDIEAVPATGWHFVEWQGGLTGATNPTTIGIIDDTTLTAVFEIDRHTLDITTVGNGEVTVNGNTYTAPMEFDYGSTIQLEALPNAGYDFDAWTGDYTHTDNPATFTLTQNMAITATFSQAGTYNVDGCLLPIEVQLINDEPEELTALGLEMVLPPGWQYQNILVDEGTGMVVPVGIDVQLLSEGKEQVEIAWSTIPDFSSGNPAMTVNVEVPEDYSGVAYVTHRALYRTTANEQSTIPRSRSFSPGAQCGGQITMRIRGERRTMTEIEEQQQAAYCCTRQQDDCDYNSADYIDSDWRIGLSELLRLIQFHNVGSYSCAPYTEDGYQAGLGATDCEPHDIDIYCGGIGSGCFGPNFVIELKDLLRAIQFFNSGGYHLAQGTEDGYAPGPPPGTEPTLDLIGNEQMVVGVGVLWDEIDPGVLAMDWEGTDLSESVEQSGEVNSDNPGIYTLTYNVSDEYCREAEELEREVLVARVVVHQGWQEISANPDDYNGDGIPDDIATIEPQPQMPNLTLELEAGAGGCHTVEWRLQTDYNRPNVPNTNGIFDSYYEPLTYFPGAPPIFTLPMSSILPYYVSFYEGFVGGTATATCRVLGDELSFQFRILGLNPDDGAARAYIDANAGNHVGYAYAIAKHESRLPGGYIYNQFNPPGAGLEYEPNKDATFGADGFGIAMLDPPPGRPYLWNWYLGIQEGIAKLDDKRSDAQSYFNAIERTYPNKFEVCTETWPPDGVAVFSALEAATIQLYNGGAVLETLYLPGHGPPEQMVVGGTDPTAYYYRSCWRFTPEAATGARWTFEANQNNYVQLISQELE